MLKINFFFLLKFSHSMHFGKSGGRPIIAVLDVLCVDRGGRKFVCVI